MTKRGPISTIWLRPTLSPSPEVTSSIDGNKRTAHAVAAVFLLNNGIEHTAAEEEVVAVMIGVAAGSLSEAELAAWFRDTSDKKARQNQEF